jgi:heme exporter protein CcmD|tara:strand:- start:715 stop:873 length:159 start_codon:yes stop_codon:yes gene_type:complete
MNEFFYMSGYGIYVWSAYIFSLLSLTALFIYYYFSLKNKEKELNKINAKNEY